MAVKKEKKKHWFLQVDKDGYFVERRKEPAEGFEKVILKTPDGGEVVKYQQKYDETSLGYFRNIYIKKVDFDKTTREFFVIEIDSDEGVDVITLPLRDSRDNLTQYVKNFIRLLPNIDFSKKYKIIPSREKNDDGYVRKFLFVRDEDNNYLKFAISKEQIPTAVKKVRAGKEYWDFTEQDEYLWKVLEENLKRFKEHKENNSKETEDVSDVPKTEENNESSAEQTNPYNPDDFDDLPF